MYADLKGYVPENVEYVLPEFVKELFPAELDFSQANGAKKFKNSAEIIKFVGDNFVATFPSGETVMRKLDEFEIRNIREEYCVMQENEVPKRKLNLEETGDLLKRAGFALSHSSKSDVIIEYFIVHGIYDLFTINSTLYDFDQPLL